MMNIQITKLEQYLAHIHHEPVEVIQIQPLGADPDSDGDLKAFGYGQPVHIIYQHDGVRKERVLRQVRRNGYGREMKADRLAAVWQDYETFNHLSRHVPAEDVLGLTHDGGLISLGEVEDFLLLTNYASGLPYAQDLITIRDTGRAQPLDRQRVRVLAQYLAKIHQVVKDDPLLWRRRLRDLIGHGEGIMGLADSYPADFAPISTAELIALENTANRWRWRLKPLHHRLRQVHGDFHPFNIIFRPGSIDFTLLDRSRGAWGEPADDVSCLAINFIFFSLQRSGRLAEPFTGLYHTFWETYLAERADDDLCRVIQPWFTWRALVLASPQWYPHQSFQSRQAMLALARNVVAADEFDWRNPQQYLED
jgi:thiamine kinase-like enzyme